MACEQKNSKKVIGKPAHGRERVNKITITTGTGTNFLAFFQLFP